MRVILVLTFSIMQGNVPRRDIYFSAVAVYISVQMFQNAVQKCLTLVQ